ASTTAGPTEAIAARLPGSVVRRVDGNPGFSSLANLALTLVEGAAFFCFCHDDVALAPDAIRLLVEEAFRSNAGIAGPKLVDWDRPNRLKSVGLAIDRTGWPIAAVEPGELDQEQHDAVRDVFVIPGGVQLVRADLLTALGGFNESIDFVGEDVDLCWRAHLAGGRVLVVPAARARHWQRLPDRLGVDAVDERASRHRLQTVFSCSGTWRLLTLVPELIVVTLLEVLGAVLAGKPKRAVPTIRAWGWVLRHLGPIRGARARNAAIRQVPDREVRNLQANGVARLRSALREHGDGERGDRIGSVAASLRGALDSLRAGRRTATIGAWFTLITLLVVGSRRLIFGRLPVVGQFVGFTTSAGSLVSSYFGRWDVSGVGKVRALPTGTMILGLFDTLVPGSGDAARVWLVLGLVVLGWIGMWRLGAPLTRAGAGTGKRRERETYVGWDDEGGPAGGTWHRPRAPRPQIAAVAVYAGAPLLSNSLGNANLQALVLYAAAPWMIRVLLRTSGLAPYRSADHTRSVGQAASFGLLVALSTAFVPLAPVLMVVLVAAVALGLALGGQRDAVPAVARVGLGGVVLGVALNLPWVFDVYGPGVSWSQLGTVKPASAPGRGLLALLRFDVGGFGPGWPALLLGAALVFAVAVARQWRFTLASVAATIVAAFLLFAWCGDRFAVALPAPEVFLTLVAAGLGLAAAVAVAAFDHDVAGSTFSLRQPLAFAALACGVVGLLPGLVAVGNGRWQLPRADFSRTLASLSARSSSTAGNPTSARTTAGDFRVLWLGDPATLPGRSWWLADGLGWSITDGTTPAVGNLWPGSPSSVEDRVRLAVNLAGTQQTQRLGQLLAPMSIRYVIVANRRAPSYTASPSHLPPASLTEALQSQADLAPVELDDALLIMENTSWLPLQSTMPDSLQAAATAGDPRSLLSQTLTPGTAVLPADIGDPRKASGPVPAGRIYVARPPGGWKLSGPGVGPRQPAFGWASSFATTGGRLTVRPTRSPVRIAVVVLQLLAWGAVIGLARRRSASSEETVR
ncbi:MAG: hypothetical protein JWL70_1619, partial [Acidimicrobiia bacterium]|nr:hypothetical protein [Acidimicrobiia bacterium]